MAKSELTLAIEKELYKKAYERGDFACHEVMLGWKGHEVVDFITYSYNRCVKCYEIKVSLSDFNSKAKLSFVGHYNYFVMTKEVWEKTKDKIDKDIGVFVLGTRGLISVKKSKKRDLKISIEVILSSMVRSMQRELLKMSILRTGVQL